MILNLLLLQIHEYCEFLRTLWCFGCCRDQQTDGSDSNSHSTSELANPAEVLIVSSDDKRMDQNRYDHDIVSRKKATPDVFIDVQRDTRAKWWKHHIGSAIPLHHLIIKCDDPTCMFCPPVSDPEMPGLEPYPCPERLRNELL